MIYLIYFLRYTILNQKINDLILDFCLISSFYLLVRFGVLETGIISILIFNVPLLVAYLNKRDISIGLLSMIIMGYYVNFYVNYIFIKYRKEDLHGNDYDSEDTRLSRRTRQRGSGSAH